MTNEELQEALERWVREGKLTTPVPRMQIWDGLQHDPRVVSGVRPSRQLLIRRFAMAASLLLAAGGTRILWGHQHVSRASAAMPLAVRDILSHHLAQSDSAIRGFQYNVGRGVWNDQMTARARELEVATRHIQSGRAAADSGAAGLLADVDFVLTEIVGYGDLTTGRPAEAEMIDYSIRVRGIVPRLGSVSAGPQGALDTRGVLRRVGEEVGRLGGRVLGVAASVLAPSVAEAAPAVPDWAADSRYRDARVALARRAYRTAADLFGGLAAQPPDLGVAGNALFWRAYSLYASGLALGDSADLRGAEAALDEEAVRYPAASTARQAVDLQARVAAAEAARGDAHASSALNAAVAALADPLSCDDGDLALKLVALERLIDRDPENAMSTIHRVLSVQGPCTDDVRRAALAIIESTPGMNATTVRRDLARADRALQPVWPGSATQKPPVSSPEDGVGGGTAGALVQAAAPGLAMRLGPPDLRLVDTALTSVVGVVIGTGGDIVALGRPPRISVFNDRGAVQYRASGPGSRPGSIGDATSLILGGADTVGVYEGSSGTLKEFWLGPHGAPYLRTVALGPAGESACSDRSTIYVSGWGDHLLHAFTRDGRPLGGFGDALTDSTVAPALRETALVRASLSRSGLACTAAGVVVAGSKVTSEVRAYGPDHALRWVTHLSAFTPMQVTVARDGSTVSFSSGPEGYEQIVNLAVLTRDVLAVQVRRHSQAGFEGDLETRLLSLVDGTQLGRQSDIPRILLARDDRVFVADTVDGVARISEAPFRLNPIARSPE